MERKIGETFEFEGKKLRVKESEEGSCNFCFFNAECKNRNLHVSGACDGAWREDGKNVIFVEVQEQQTEEPRERKIGEVFEYEGKKLKVVETEKDSCNNCYLEDCECAEKGKVCGACLSETRTDNKPVIFVEVKDEQPQEEQPKLNLCEVLKDCPKGEMFWSPIFGNVLFFDIDQLTKRVKVRTSSVGSWYINADGTITIDRVTSPEIMLYPSRKQRDWAKVKYEKKKERFDPKTLKPFDKVLVKVTNPKWKAALFSHYDCDYMYPYICVGSAYKYCIPYNDETKHLVGTTDEAPEYYRYWED